MRYAPAMIQQLSSLHQRDLLAQAQDSRRIAQLRATTPVFVEKETSMQTLVQHLTSLTASFVLHPRAATAVAVALALVAALLLGPDGADAGARLIIGGGRTGGN